MREIRFFFRFSLHFSICGGKYKFSEDHIKIYTVQMGDQSLVEIPIDKFDFDRNAIQFGGDVSITAVKPVIIIVQDEAIFRSYDGAKKFWKQKGRQKLRKKGEGQGVMASAFLSEQLGFISISPERLAEINALRAQLQKASLEILYRA